MGGFAAGLSQGLEVARDRQMQAQQLQLQQDMAKAADSMRAAGLRNISAGKKRPVRSKSSTASPDGAARVASITRCG